MANTERPHTLSSASFIVNHTSVQSMYIFIYISCTLMIVHVFLSWLTLLSDVVDAVCRYLIAFYN